MHIATKMAEFRGDNETWTPCFLVGRTRSGLTILNKILADYTPIADCRDQGMLLRFKDLLGVYGDLTVRSTMLRLIQDILNSYEYKHLLHGPEIEPMELYNRLPEMTYAALMNEVRPEMNKLPPVIQQLEVRCGLFNKVKLKQYFIPNSET